MMVPVYPPNQQQHSPKKPSQKDQGHDQQAFIQPQIVYPMAHPLFS